jgi:4-hydroxy-tetrahydrodipicolinate synthase
MADTQSKARFGWVITAMVTPFTDTLEIDESGVNNVVDHLIANGSQSIVVCGTTGETPTLSHDEKLKMYSLVKKHAAGRAQVIAGVGTNNTAESIRLAKEADELGADGLLVIAPYYNRPSQDGMFQHFTAIAKAVPNQKILLYNVPPRTSSDISPETAVRSAIECPNIVGIKEASSKLDQIGEIARTAPVGFEVYSGEDAVNLPILSIGGVGIISVTSHIAGKTLHKMHEAFFAGDYTTAKELHLKTLPLTRALFCVNSPTPTKYALHKMGVIASPKVRLPLSEINEAEARIVDKALAEFEA